MPLNFSTHEPITSVFARPTNLTANRFVIEEIHMRAPSADRAVAWTLSIGSNRIDCFLHRKECGLQVLIQTSGQPLYLRMLDNMTDARAWAEQERTAWASTL